MIRAAALLLLVLPACTPAPVQVLGVAVVEEPDSVRWERAEGTPWATALTWRSGTMNLWTEHSVIAAGFSGVCRAEALVVHRAALPVGWAGGDTISGVPAAYMPGSDPVAAASAWLVCSGDTMRGEARAVFPTPCGPVEERLPLTLVRVP